MRHPLAHYLVHDILNIKVHAAYSHRAKRFSAWVAIKEHAASPPPQSSYLTDEHTQTPSA